MPNSKGDQIWYALDWKAITSREKSYEYECQRYAEWLKANEYEV